MSIRRVVPDISSERLDESREFYVGVIGFELVMDLGFVMTFASPSNPTAQITIMRSDGWSGPVPEITVEVLDVDAVHAEAVRRGAEVVYPLTDERWGVCRFFLRDPNGVVINVMRHIPGAAG
jgi:catechol 2,3-dioxygenase-like lactoylglutathione lyase family enzyme